MADKEKAHKYRTEIQQMMFVSGETQEPAPETTMMIEQIVQQQVQEMLRECTLLATRRGSRSISIDDLMMLIRHDKAKISRLRHFLQWKDVRKNFKDQEADGKGGGDAADLAGDDELGAGLAAGPAGPTAEAGKKTKRPKVELVWDVQSFFAESVPPRDDEEDEEGEEMNYATLQRLKNADERTKDMTKEEYVHWSECRQASFTFRKTKRFREFAGFDVYLNTKPDSDIIDVFGFLTYEIVQTITEEALRVKNAEDVYRKSVGGDEEGGGARKRKRERGLFDEPEGAREPVQPRHIREAFRRLQGANKKSRAMLSFTRAAYKAPLKLI